jgi:hypothetical protein
LLGACASPATSAPENQFTGQRTVFYNPYAAPELQNGPVGPEQCAECPGVEGRWLDGLIYPGRGHYAYDRDGNRVQLSRSDRRELRRRFQAIEVQAEINRRVAEFGARQASIPPAIPTAPPLASPPAAPPEAPAPNARSNSSAPQSEPN